MKKRRFISMVLATGMAMNLFANGTVFGADDNLWRDSTSIVTTRVSVASDGTQSNGNSILSDISADGRYVVYPSEATNLVSNDTNGKKDIFWHDTKTGETKIVSIAGDGTQGDGDSDDPEISGDGRYVVYQSSATNLVSGDTNGCIDVFMYDMQNGTTTRVSIASDGTQGDGLSCAPTISSDGRYVVYTSMAKNIVSGITTTTWRVYMYDTQTATAQLLSKADDGTLANAPSMHSSISGDGHYVAFMSQATNLISGDTNAKPDIYVYNTQTATVARVSVASNGAQGDSDSTLPQISDDGNFVVFQSSATNLASGDTNGCMDVFEHNMQTGITTRVSVASDGTQGNAYSGPADVSGDGKYVVFWSEASNFVAGDTYGTYDEFVYDMQTGSTRRVSETSDGTPANGEVDNPVISSNGKYVSYYGLVSNLVSGDTNGKHDVFLATAVDLTTDANLSNLAISSGTLSPTFAADTTEYTASVGSDVNSLIVTPTIEYSGATVKVNGTSVTSGSASQAISLSSGTNTIPVVVTAADGTTTKTYTITVTKASSGYAIAMKVTSIAAYNEAVVTIKNSAGSVLYTLNPGTDGVLTTPLLPVGSYTVECSKAGFLKTTIRNIPIVDKAVTLSNVVLTPGDLDGDGKINTTDTTIINSCYNVTSSSGKYKLVYDFNRDGKINTSERSAVFTNYGKSNTVIDYVG